MKKVLSCVLLVTMIVSMFVVTTVFAGTPAADANGITPYAIIDSTDVGNISTKESGAKVETVEDNGKSVIKLTPQSGYSYIGIKIPASKITQPAAGTTWYAKMKLRYDNSMTYLSGKGIQWWYSGADWNWASVSEAEFNSMKGTYGFNTYSAKAVKTTDDFEMNIQTFTAGANDAIYIEYIAFFTDAAAAADYDAAIDNGEKNGITPTNYITAKNIDSLSGDGGTTIQKGTYNGTSAIVATPGSGKGFAKIKNKDYSLTPDFKAGKTTYVKVKYHLDTQSEYDATRSGVYLYYCGSDYSFTKTSETDYNTAKSGWLHYYEAETMKSTDLYEMVFQNFAANTDTKIYIEYIAFFDSEQDCIDYDQPAYPKVSNGGKSADFDRSTKTLNFLCAPQTSADDIKAMTFEIENGDVFSFSGDWAESTEGKYLVMKRTIADSTDAANTWTLVVKSRNQYEVLGLLDCTDSANDSRFKAEYTQTNIGRHTLGDNSVLYFEDNGKANNETYISIDLKDIIDITTTPLYVKIAYRVEDVTEKVDGKALFLRTAYNSKDWENVAVIGYGDVEDYQGHWTTAVHKMTNVTTKTDDRFALATVNARTKLSIKYIAFFETEADAMHYTFGDIGATINGSGNEITANFNNTENARNGARFVAVYKGNELVKVEMSNNKDELSISDVPAGEYIVKAFYWSDTDEERTPLFDGVSKNVTIS